MIWIFLSDRMPKIVRKLDLTHNNILGFHYQKRGINL